MLKKILRIHLVILTILLSFPNHSFASSPNISSFPEVINLNDSFSLKVSMEGLSSNSIYRLRIVLSDPGTTGYFGSTFNEPFWYNGTPSPIDYSKFLTVTTDSEGDWTGDIEGKVESSDPNYKSHGSTNYDLKVGRYTKSGSSATWSNIVTVKLNAPDPTATPTPTSKPTPTPTKSPTPVKSSVLSSSATSKLSNPTTLASSYRSSGSISPNAGSKSADISAVPTSILAKPTKSKAKNSSSLTNNNRVLVKSENNNTLITFAIICGSILLMACGILVYRKKRAKNETGSNE